MELRALTTVMTIRTNVARLAVGEVGVVKVDVRPILGGMAARTLSSPVTIRRRMAACTVVVAGVVEVDLAPYCGGVTGGAGIEVMLLGCAMAQCAVYRQHNVVDRGHIPGRSFVTIGARVRVVPFWCAVAAGTVGGGVVSVDDVVPAPGRVAGGAASSVVCLRCVVTVGAGGISGMVKVDIVGPGCGHVAIRADPFIVRIGGVTGVAVQARAGVDVVEALCIPGAGDVAARALIIIVTSRGVVLVTTGAGGGSDGGMVEGSILPAIEVMTV